MRNTTDQPSAKQTQSQLPEHGSSIVFIKTPLHSYAKTGKVYQVSVEGNHIHLESPTGSTFDRAWSYRWADWKLA
jgi:hypothetical protein